MCASRHLRQMTKSPFYRYQRQVQTLVNDWLNQSETELRWQFRHWERQLQQTDDLELKWLHRVLVEGLNTLEMQPQERSEAATERVALLFEMHHAVNRVRDPRRIRASLARRQE